MKNTANHGMTYVCPHCDHRMKTSIPEPDHWPDLPGEKFDTSAYRHLCERCKRFALPASYLMRHNGTQMLFHHFSVCPNAHACHIVGHYDADCERGQVMQKCFASLHISLNVLLKHVVEHPGIGHNHPAWPKK